MHQSNVLAQGFSQLFSSFRTLSRSLTLARFVLIAFTATYSPAQTYTALYEFGAKTGDPESPQYSASSLRVATATCTAPHPILRSVLVPTAVRHSASAPPESSLQFTTSSQLAWAIHLSAGYRSESMATFTARQGLEGPLIGERFSGLPRAEPLPRSITSVLANLHVWMALFQARLRCKARMGTFMEPRPTQEMAPPTA